LGRGFGHEQRSDAFGDNATPDWQAFQQDGSAGTRTRTSGVTGWSCWFRADGDLRHAGCMCGMPSCPGAAPTPVCVRRRFGRLKLLVAIGAAVLYILEDELADDFRCDHFRRYQPSLVMKALEEFNAWQDLG
jgi:hypothetical protein